MARNSTDFDRKPPTFDLSPPATISGNQEGVSPRPARNAAEAYEDCSTDRTGISEACEECSWGLRGLKLGWKWYLRGLRGLQPGLRR
ncbi:unnamed protein product [Prunus armeniaca]